MKRKIVRRTVWYLVFLVALLALWATLTNPFVRWNLVKAPFETRMVGEEIELYENNDITVFNRGFFRGLAEFKSGWHIVSSRFVGGPKAKEANLSEIIHEIHQIRFDPGEPFLISGDHFSVFYPRSLGVFYHSLLDSRTALDDDDWQRRQRIYLQSTAFALEVFEKSGELSTTIVPIAPKTVTQVNVYSKPSDTLYSLLYALSVMTDENEIKKIYPFSAPEKHLQTKKAARELLEKYKNSLGYFLDKFKLENVDPIDGIIRKDVLLSSTKDISKRESAFYDNVVYWRTLQLADNLGIRKVSSEELDTLKQKILADFWYEKGGFFLEDLSDESLTNKYYSSDWLMAYMTGFLSPDNPDEKMYFTRSLEYIAGTGLNRPIGLPYQNEPRRQRQYPLVRMTANDYGSLAIWSNWGMEYIKLLGAMHSVTDKQMYLDEAKYQLDEYEKRMVLYRGYPELYDRKGRFFSKLLYKSVRRTGWVVSYEQAKMMIDSLDAR